MSSVRNSSHVKPTAARGLAWMPPERYRPVWSHGGAPPHWPPAFAVAGLLRTAVSPATAGQFWTPDNASEEASLVVVPTRKARASRAFLIPVMPVSGADGGEGEIRTPGDLRHTAFRERHHQPLGHLSTGECTKPPGLQAPSQSGDVATRRPRSVSSPQPVRWRSPGTGCRANPGRPSGPSPARPAQIRRRPGARVRVPGCRHPPASRSACP